MMTYATKHAEVRMREYFGQTLSTDQWRAIVENARVGLYPKERTRPMHPKAARHRKRKTARRRAPVYLVPVGCPDEGWQRLVPMAINTAERVVVTVLPPREAPE